MSTRLWDLDWREHLPCTFDGISLDYGTFEDALTFMEEHYSGIFGVEAERFLVERMTESKRRFWHEMDVFVFRSGGAAIGIAAGHPTDWSTYYVRTIALLADFRGRGCGTAFYRYLSCVLREAGVTRWEVECSPANAATIRIFLREGLLQTASVASDRWGALLRFTKFLKEDAASVFERQFLYVRNSRDLHR